MSSAPPHSVVYNTRMPSTTPITTVGAPLVTAHGCEVLDLQQPRWSRLDYAAAIRIIGSMPRTMEFEQVVSPKVAVAGYLLSHFTIYS